MSVQPPRANNPLMHPWRDQTVIANASETRWRRLLEQVQVFLIKNESTTAVVCWGHICLQGGLHVKEGGGGSPTCIINMCTTGRCADKIHTVMFNTDCYFSITHIS